MADSTQHEGLHRDEDWLRTQYHGEGKSLSEVATAAGVSSTTTILRWMKKHDIPRRPNANHVDVTDEMVEVLDGLLAGDGCLVRENKAVYYIHTDANEGFRDWLADLLEEVGLEVSARWNDERDYGTFYYLRTPAYRELTDVHNRWYDHRQKQYPDDMHLTPTALLLWWVGDGTIRDTEWGAPAFCLNCQNPTLDMRGLADRIEDAVGVTISVTDNGFYIKTDSHSAWQDYLSKSPLSPTDYEHKLSLSHKR